MFVKTNFTQEELQQINTVNDTLDTLRNTASAYDKGEDINAETLQALIDDILENVAPLAERLGMHAEQKELQDTCIRIGYPEDYAKLKRLLQESEASCEMVFKTFALPIRAMIDDLGIEYEFLYRMKSIYSIWRKMRIDHKEFDDVYDLFATRIVYKVPENITTAPWEVQQPKETQDLCPTPSEALPQPNGNIDIEKLFCWRIYNVIAMLYRIHPDRIKNWVSNPKPSGYQALQMTVMGPDCNWVEIQIRSERMDYEAEQGAAAHWKYKEETAVK
ncbi:MAG: bifunctional (p)ppGpp synthetase/guanosine-3',5'-bis(diphosphate) 3'-pyrophosphohydrolase [Prevotella sp.]|nr:bifunctional (p)ppGpp synthetase/guanosine-3',5'-bis(diphosphate) 3'-pyrophosphohydrolase [Candidatus Prevotella equi]